MTRQKTTIGQGGKEKKKKVIKGRNLGGMVQDQGRGRVHNLSWQLSQKVRQKKQSGIPLGKGRGPNCSRDTTGPRKRGGKKGKGGKGGTPNGQRAPGLGKKGGKNGNGIICSPGQRG